MAWKFWRQARPRELPAGVRQALESRFHLDTRTIDALRLLDKAGLVAGQKVRFIRIFDPSRIDAGAVADPSYDDLQMSGCRTALCFEGHINRGGDVFLADRRPPKMAYRSASSSPPKRPSPQKQ